MLIRASQRLFGREKLTNVTVASKRLFNRLLDQEKSYGPLPASFMPQVFFAD